MDKIEMAFRLINNRSDTFLVVYNAHYNFFLTAFS